LITPTTLPPRLASDRTFTHVLATAGTHRTESATITTVGATALFAPGMATLLRASTVFTTPDVSVISEASAADALALDADDAFTVGSTRDATPRSGARAADVTFETTSSARGATSRSDGPNRQVAPTTVTMQATAATRCHGMAVHTERDVRTPQVGHAAS